MKRNVLNFGRIEQLDRELPKSSIRVSSNPSENVKRLKEELAKLEKKVLVPTQEDLTVKAY